MKQLKKTLLTLVALLAVTTQSWATAPTVYSEAVAISQLQVGDILTPGFSLTGNGTVSLQGDRWKMDGNLQSGSNTLVENSYITYNSDGTLTIMSMSVTPVDGDGNDGNAWEVTATSPEITIAGTTYTPATGTAVTFTRGTGDKADEWTMDGGMPAGNVTVSVEYYDLATLATDAVTAATEAAANTDAQLVTVADNATTGGTLMYYVTADANFTQAQAIALAETAWSEDVPTADGFNFDTATDVYVWYYLKGDAEHSDTDPVCVAVTLLPEPTYNVEFAEGIDDADKWSASPNTGVKKGETVTVTYSGTRKVIGVKAEKKAEGAKGKTLAEATVGMIVGSDGKAYAADDKDNLPDGVTAVAKVCYVYGNNGHGLAMALADESGTMQWGTAQTTCAAHTPAVTGCTWKLANKVEWTNMINAAGGYDNMRNGFSSVDGTNLQSSGYWTDTEYESDAQKAYICYFSTNRINQGWKNSSCYARACLEW